MSSEGPPFLVLFVGNYGALNLHLPVVSLSELVTMSGPARNLLSLNMSRLHFLVLVLQVSNSFDLNSFFHVLFSLIFTVYGGHVHSLAESLCLTNFLFKVECRFSFFLFPSCSIKFLLFASGWIFSNLGTCLFIQFQTL